MDDTIHDLDKGPTKVLSEDGSSNTMLEFALLGARVHQEILKVVTEHSQLTELRYQRHH